MITRQEDDEDKYDTGMLPGDIEKDKKSKKRGPRKRTRKANEAEQANPPRLAD
jgi:hypothetical protein